MGLAPSERLKLWRHGKKSTTSLLLFMEAFGLEVEEDLHSGHHQVLGRRGVD